MFELNGRSFFSAPREHGPQANFFCLSALDRIIKTVVFSLTLTAGQLHAMKRKAEKQQAGGKLHNSMPRDANVNLTRLSFSSSAERFRSLRCAQSSPATSAGASRTKRGAASCSCK
jgi:hypothetical protein